MNNIMSLRHISENGNEFAISLELGGLSISGNPPPLGLELTVKMSKPGKVHLIPCWSVVTNDWCILLFDRKMSY